MQIGRLSIPRMAATVLINHLVVLTLGLRSRTLALCSLLIVHPYLVSSKTTKNNASPRLVLPRLAVEALCI